MTKKRKYENISNWLRPLFDYSKLKAKMWSQLYRFYDWINVKTMGAKSWLLILLYFIVAISSTSLSFLLNETHADKLAISGALSQINSVLSTTGQTLLGASAITFSFIVFAMQVNVERMPYGLFRQLSSDVRLLALFTISVSASIFLASASLFESVFQPIQMLVLGINILVGILIVFVLAYQRALLLINPLKQLSHLVLTASVAIDAWGSRADKLTPLLKDQSDEQKDKKPPFDSDLDYPRLTFFRVNHHWLGNAKQAILYAISISRTYSERGDHQVSAAALSAISAIHKKHVEIRGNTFVVSNSFFDNPLSGDGFLSDTLEHLRQNVRLGIRRGDEQQVEQSFQTLGSLVTIYAGAGYGNAHGGKFEPSLASGYLSRAVKTSVEMKSPDVLMEGVRCLGKASAALLRSLAQQQDIGSLSELRTIAAVGVTAEDYRPVTQSCVGELTEILFSLLLGADHIRKHNIRQVRDDLNFIASVILEIPDAPMVSPHSSCLTPYYSTTTLGNFSSRMVELTNQLLDAEENDEVWQNVASNVCKFADQSYEGSKEIFLKSVEKEVAFTFDIVHWISTMSKLLCAISTAPAAKHVSDELQKHAVWLFSVLTFVPDEKEKVQHVQTWSMLSALFETVYDVANRIDPDKAMPFVDVLVTWVFKSGTHDDYQFAEGLLSLIAIVAIDNSSFEKPIIESAVKAWKGRKEFTNKKKLAVEKILSEKIGRGLRSELSTNQAEVFLSRLSQKELEIYLGNFLEALKK